MPISLFGTKPFRCGPVHWVEQQCVALTLIARFRWIARATGADSRFFLGSAKSREADVWTTAPGLSLGPMVARDSCRF